MFTRIPRARIFLVTLLACSVAPLAAQTEDEALWKKLDSNPDGWLDGKELEGGWIKFDTDGDKEVTKAEFMAGRAKERAKNSPSIAEIKELFNKFDITGNGYLTGKELDDGNARAYDINKDGAVSLEEFLAGRALQHGGTATVPPAVSKAAPNKATSTPSVPAKTATQNSAPNVKPISPPAPLFSAQKISGVFYMQKYWIATRHLEKAVWYFAPDGKVYVNPEKGFTSADLAAIKDSNKGTYKIAGKNMTVTWANGQKSEDELEIVPGGFNWNTGMYLPVAPFTDGKQLVGRYEGGTSMTFSGNSTVAVKTLELKTDGTFSWSGIAKFDTGGTITSGEGATTGKWNLSGYILSLTATDGTVVHSVTFPFDDAATAIKPDRIFFAGTMYKKLQ